jgi:hypothetical protein
MDFEEYCSICYGCLASPYKHPKCRQMFCLDCILPVFVHNRTPKCPKCRDPLDPGSFPCVVPGYVSPHSSSRQRNSYSCPLCSAGSYSRIGLTAHVDSLHARSSALCPICLTMPWVSPRTPQVLGEHLITCHRSDNESFEEFAVQDENAVLEALRLSLLD